MELKHDQGQTLNYFFVLLIVPYGIETNYSLVLEVTLPAFNRTLWN